MFRRLPQQRQIPGASAHRISRSNVSRLSAPADKFGLHVPASVGESSSSASCRNRSGLAVSPQSPAAALDAGSRMRQEHHVPESYSALLLRTSESWYASNLSNALARPNRRISTAARPCRSPSSTWQATRPVRRRAGSHGQSCRAIRPRCPLPVLEEASRAATAAHGVAWLHDGPRRQFCANSTGVTSAACLAMRAAMLSPDS